MSATCCQKFSSMHLATPATFLFNNLQNNLHNSFYKKTVRCKLSITKFTSITIGIVWRVCIRRPIRKFMNLRFLPLIIRYQFLDMASISQGILTPLCRGGSTRHGDHDVHNPPNEVSLSELLNYPNFRGIMPLDAS